MVNGVCWPGWFKMTIEHFSFFDPMSSQCVSLTDGVWIFSHQEIPCIDFVPAQEREFILQLPVDLCRIKRFFIDLFRFFHMLTLFKFFNLFQNAILVRHPTKFLEDTAITLENFSVDLWVLWCDLWVEIRVLYFDFEVVRYSKRLDFIWQVTQRIIISDPERILH